MILGGAGTYFYFEDAIQESGGYRTLGLTILLPLVMLVLLVPPIVINGIQGYRHWRSLRKQEQGDEGR